MMEAYASFYPALRRLLRLGIAVVLYHGLASAGRDASVVGAFTEAERFLDVFDAYRAGES